VDGRGGTMSATVDSELRSVDPATLEVVGTVRIAPPEEIAEAVAEARAAQRAWGETGFEERRRLLGRVAEAVLDMGDEISATVTAETGKPLVESITSELFVGLDNLIWCARNAGTVLARERLRNPQPHLRHKRGFLRYEPLGAVAVVSPWNFPFGIPFTETATAVAAGNAVLLKPSELTPLTGALVERAFRAAGSPAGLVRVLQGGGAVGEALARAPGIAKVFFTGSVEVGREVAAAAGSQLRPVTLELGGKDPMLVLDDADLDRAVEGALWGSFSNCGQVCSGVERIYVARAVYEPFVEELVRRARSLRVGAGSDPSSELGPLISEEARDRVEGLVADAVEQGAELRTGGGRPETGLPGWFLEPTVLAGSHGRIEREEIFGPVVTVEPFGEDEEALRLANASPFGLGASVWTRDAARAGRLADRLEAGSVWTNDVAYSYGAGQASWGGVKQSGYGRTHSKHGLYGCSQVKFVGLDAGRVAVPWWYPYGADAADGLRGMADVLYRSGLGARAAAAWRHRRGLVHLGRRYLGG
jgi:succinate-semialdehyde dehydrogenase/glutarate-semialdehyde dehydrogenase